MDGFISRKEVMKQLRVSRTTFYRLQSSGLLPAAHKYGSRWWYPLEEVAKVLRFDYSADDVMNLLNIDQSQLLQLCAEGSLSRIEVNSSWRYLKVQIDEMATLSFSQVEWLLNIERSALSDYTIKGVIEGFKVNGQWRYRKAQFEELEIDLDDQLMKLNEALGFLGVARATFYRKYVGMLRIVEIGNLHRYRRNDVAELKVRAGL